jgi:hypothetical protein
MIGGLLLLLLPRLAVVALLGDAVCLGRCEGLLVCGCPGRKPLGEEGSGIVGPAERSGSKEVGQDCGLKDGKSEETWA